MLTPVITNKTAILPTIRATITINKGSRIVVQVFTSLSDFIIITSWYVFKCPFAYLLSLLQQQSYQLKAKEKILLLERGLDILVPSLTLILANSISLEVTILLIVFCTNF